MQTLRSLVSPMFRRFVRDEKAATAIEYAMIAAGVAGVVIVAVTALGTDLKTTFYDKLSSLL